MNGVAEGYYIWLSTGVLASSAKPTVKRSKWTAGLIAVS